MSKQLNVEERIWVLQNDGMDYGNLIIDAIEETYLLCHNNQTEVLIIPYSSIERIETYHFSKSKTIALALPAALFLGLIIGLSIQEGL